jgi:hypothetical protein
MEFFFSTGKNLLYNFFAYACFVSVSYLLSYAAAFTGTTVLQYLRFHAVKIQKTRGI